MNQEQNTGNLKFSFFAGSEGKIYLFLFFTSLICFSLFTWAPPLFDWDEINFAESSREMLVTGNYFQVQIDFRPFWEKPPLYFWMQAVSMKIFGVNEFAARFPNALTGALTLCVLFFYGRRFRSMNFGWLLVGLYTAGFLPQMYFKSGIIDPVFNLFIFLGVLQIIRAEQNWRDGKSTGAFPWLGGLFTGLATLTKGPVAILVTVLAWGVFKIVNDRFRISFSIVGKYLAVLTGVILVYFGSLVLFTHDGVELMRKFIVYQAELFLNPVAGHEQPVFYHPVIFLLGCFPLAGFAVRGMFFKPEDDASRAIRKFMLILFWVVMILFSIVQTKIVHYSSLVYFPAVFLAAYYLDDLILHRKKIRTDTWVLLGLGAFCLSIPILLVNFITGDKEWLHSKMTNDFSRAVALADVNWTGFEFLSAVFFICSVGYGFFLLTRARYYQWLALSAASMIIYLNLLVGLVAPRIADYTQTAAIEFWKQHAEEEAWMITGYYKSYAQYFYGKAKPLIPPAESEWEKNDRLTKYPLDRPVYMVARADKVNKDSFKEVFAKFERIGQKNGYVFFVRKP